MRFGVLVFEFDATYDKDGDKDRENETLYVCVGLTELWLTVDDSVQGNVTVSDWE